MKLEINKDYDLYVLVLEINKSLNDLYSFIGLTKNSDRIVVRYDKNLTILKGTIYHVNGKALEYKNRIHLFSNNIISINEMELSMEEKMIIENSLLGFYDIDHEICIKYIEDEISTINNDNLRKLVETIYKDKKDRFIDYPAATKFHHPYKHGLLYHTYNSLRIGISLANIYSNISIDLVKSGLILHDIMKTVEIDPARMEYTLDGKLFGHITLGALEVEKYADKLNISELEEVTLLKHILLTHHSEQEFGSPKKPQIIEALIVHLADMSDAKIEPTIEALEKTKIGEFTDSIMVNDKVKFYRHNIK